MNSYGRQHESHESDVGNVTVEGVTTIDVLLQSESSRPPERNTQAACAF
jgi:hypothetical protein